MRPPPRTNLFLLPFGDVGQFDAGFQLLSAAHSSPGFWFPPQLNGLKVVSFVVFDKPIGTNCESRGSN